MKRKSKNRVKNIFLNSKNDYINHAFLFYENYWGKTMGSLRDQLEKLGFKKSTVPTKIVTKTKGSIIKKEPTSGSIKINPLPNASSTPKVVVNSSPQQGQTSQKQVTFCESCSGTFPDVEYYEHKNKILSAKWLCCRCADKNCIHDDTRQTVQSDFAKRGLFRREYGPTNKKLRAKK